MDFSSSRAAEDSSCIVSKNPALKPTSCCKALFYLRRCSISLPFWNNYFYKSSIFPLNSPFYRVRRSSGSALLSAISFSLFLSNSSSKDLLNSFISAILSSSLSFTCLISDLMLSTSSPCNDLSRSIES